MPNEFTGTPYQVDDSRFAIVVSRYNESITSKLLSGAVTSLSSAGVDDGRIDVAWVPGAWEIPLIASQMAESGKYDAIICLGAVIRGETTHDQHINRQVSLSLGDLGIREQLPVLFGLLTCESMEQAIHRSGGNVGNKGEECAEAALEMVTLVKRIEDS